MRYGGHTARRSWVEPPDVNNWALDVFETFLEGGCDRVTRSGYREIISEGTPS